MNIGREGDVREEIGQAYLAHGAARRGHQRIAPKAYEATS